MNENPLKMKKHIYLFNEGSRAAVYGIGTYIRQMITCLTSIEDLVLHIVRLNSDVECFEVVNSKNGYEEINFPSSLFSMGDRWKRHYRNCWYLIHSNMQIKKEEPVYFLLNYTNHHLMIPEIKKTFPSCQITFVIHYQNWCFALNGNIKQIQSLLKKDKYTLNSKEQGILKSFYNEKQAYELVDRVICLSHFTENLLWKLYEISPDKTEVIYNGLEEDIVYSSTTIRNDLKRQLGFSEKEKIILYVGRLDSIKGIKSLIHSFISLISERKDCRLVLIGDGDFSTYLKECNGYWDLITFTGRLEKDQLYQFYQIADIGILPSMHEQCSYTAIEMMMHGIPMIVSTSTGLNEMIEENYNGLHVPIKEHMNEVEIDTNLLAKKIIYLLQNPKKRKQMGINARNYYEKRYAIEIMRTKMINFYNSLYK